MSAPVPYPADTRAQGCRLAFDFARVRQSDAWALAGASLRPWMLMLWTIAWEQVPCGSLPDDDELIASHIGMDVERFREASHTLLRGWKKAADGRLYEPMLTEHVLEMLKARNRKWRAFRDEVFRVHGPRCAYCGSTEFLTLDHVIPRANGGQDDPSNLVPACRPCNSSKGKKSLAEWQGRRTRSVQFRSAT